MCVNVCECDRDHVFARCLTSTHTHTNQAQVYSEGCSSPGLSEARVVVMHDIRVHVCVCVCVFVCLCQGLCLCVCMYMCV